MKRFPIFFDPEMSVHELAVIFRDAGLHLHSDSFGRTVVDRVPAFLKHDEAEIVPLKRRKRA